MSERRNRAPTRKSAGEIKENRRRGIRAALRGKMLNLNAVCVLLRDQVTVLSRGKDMPLREERGRRYAGCWEESKLSH